ncbi:hypothetical protein DWW78_05705 [Alistipes indistinctus]|nr:hypothetical protein [Alistipes indistinctus]RGU37194.1 hypothetical protein DWW78_05705 [Alistipes indistinctus]
MRVIAAHRSSRVVCGDPDSDFPGTGLRNPAHNLPEPREQPSDSPERYGEAPRLLQRNTPLRTAFMPQTKIVFFADQQTDQTRFRLFSTDFRRKFHHNGTCFTKIAVT